MKNKWFYGKNITDKEKLTAQKLVKANSINLDCNVSGIAFIQNIEEVELRYNENCHN